MFYIISTTIDYMYQLCFLYMLNYSVIYSLSEREIGRKHERNCVYLRKIENCSYNQELLSHPMPEHVDELNRLVRKIPANFP